MLNNKNVYVPLRPREGKTTVMVGRSRLEHSFSTEIIRSTIGTILTNKRKIVNWSYVWTTPTCFVVDSNRLGRTCTAAAVHRCTDAAEQTSESAHDHRGCNRHGV